MSPNQSRKTTRCFVPLLASLGLLLVACGSGEAGIEQTDPGSQSADLDSDGIIDAEDDDIDGDGFSNEEEGNGQIDSDGDGITDDRDRDSDNDGRFDIDEQRGDADGDGEEGRLDRDSDGDGTADGADQTGGSNNNDGDGSDDNGNNNGDDGNNNDGGVEVALGVDTDLDSVPDDVDNCPEAANADQLDSDGDGVGNVCDSCPQDSGSSEPPCDDDEVPVPGGNGCRGLSVGGGGSGPIFISADVSTSADGASGGTATIVALDGFATNVFGGCVDPEGGYGGPLFRCSDVTVTGPADIEVIGVYDDGIYFTFNAGSGGPPTAIGVVGDDCDDTSNPTLGPALNLADLKALAVASHPEVILTIDPAVTTPAELETLPELAVRQLIEDHFADLSATQLAVIDDGLLLEASADQVPKLEPAAIAMLPPGLLVKVAPETLIVAMGDDLNTLPDAYFQRLDPQDFRAFGIDATSTLDTELLSGLELPDEFVGEGLIEVPGP